MTLEQAIASYEKSAERYHKAFLHCKAHGGEFYQEEAESNKICYEHDRQLAAWLRELQERREEPEKAQLSPQGTTSDQHVATDTNVGNNSEIPNSSDAVSRQAVLDAIVQCTNCGDEDTLREYVLKHSLDNGWTGGILEALDAVKDLPTIQPEPQEGYWIPHEGIDGDIQYECSECGVLWEFNDGTPEDNEAYFCPKCGAKMKGAQNG